MTTKALLSMATVRSTAPLLILPRVMVLGLDLVLMWVGLVQSRMGGGPRGVLTTSWTRPDLQLAGEVVRMTKSQRWTCTSPQRPFGQGWKGEGGVSGPCPFGRLTVQSGMN